MRKENLGPIVKELLKWSTCSIALYPVIPNIGNSIAIILWTFLVVTYKVVVRNGVTTVQPARDKNFFFIYGGSFLLLLISLSYSINVKYGISKLGTQVPMFLFPFIFFLLPFPFTIRKEFLKRVLNVFLWSTVLVCLWLIYHYWKLNLLNELDKASSFNTIFRETAEDLTNKHPTILSIYFSFSLIIAVDNILNADSHFFKLLNVLCILVLSALLLILASRAPIVATFIAVLFFTLRKIKLASLRFGLFACFAVLFFLLVRFTPAIYSRVQEALKTDLAVPEGMQFNSTNIRVGIYKCTWQLIKAKPLVGYGVGSNKMVLNDCYAQFPTDAYKNNSYNTHNQYANFWLLNGVPGILLFLSSVLYALYLSVKYKEELFLYFLVLFGICFLTDDLLTRQSGVVIYYFFLCLFLLHLKSKWTIFVKESDVYNKNLHGSIQ